MEKMGVEEGEVIEHGLVTSAIEPRAEARRGAQLRHPQAPARVRQRHEQAARGGLPPARQARCRRTSASAVPTCSRPSERPRRAARSGGVRHRRRVEPARARRRAVVPAAAPVTPAARGGRRPAGTATACRRSGGDGLPGARGASSRPRSCASSSATSTCSRSTSTGATTCTSSTTCKGGIGLRAYGQRDPLVEYKKEAFALFETLLSEVREEFVQRLFRVQLQPAAQREVDRRAARRRSRWSRSTPRPRRSAARRGRPAAAAGEGPAGRRAARGTPPPVQAPGARRAARRPQRSVPVRQRQEVQEVPRPHDEGWGQGMSDERSGDPVVRLLRLLAERLEDYLEGDELAFETLAERIEEEGCTADDLHAAILALRGLCGEPPLGGGRSRDAPGGHAQRVPSAEEREILSTEAWGYLLDLRGRGTLNAEQFERVLERSSISRSARSMSSPLARSRRASRCSTTISTTEARSMATAKSRTKAPKQAAGDGPRATAPGKVKRDREPAAPARDAREAGTQGRREAHGEAGSGGRRGRRPGRSRGARQGEGQVASRRAAPRSARAADWLESTGAPGHRRVADQVADAHQVPRQGLHGAGLERPRHGPAQGQLGVDVDNDFEPQYVPIREQAQALAKIRAAAKQARPHLPRARSRPRGRGDRVAPRRGAQAARAPAAAPDVQRDHPARGHRGARCSRASST